MALLFIHDMTADSLAHYDAGIRQLEAVGQGHPEGRVFHAAAQKGSGYIVVDLWESRAALDRFAATLLPILAQLGSPNALPQVYPVHNTIMAD